MADFVYKEPKLCKDKDNKKWFVRYSIKYPGDEKFDTRKEYGRSYFSQSLNLIESLKDRESAFKDLVKAISIELSNGIDKKKPEIYKAKIEAEILESKKYSFDQLFKYYCDDKGYSTPVSKKELSAANIKAFFNNQFKPFLVSKGLDKDLSKITKPDVLEFMNRHYHSSDPATKWNNNTYNNRKGWIHGFFKLLIDEDKLTIENPTDRIRVKESAPTKRFEVFSREERDAIFNYFDNGGDTFMSAILRVIYYAYVRESEISRLQVSDFNFETKQILINPEKAKKQVDNLPRWVFMPDKLIISLEKYLSTFNNIPSDYIFGKGFKPSRIRLINNWQRKFRKAIIELRKNNPKLFKTDNQSPYSFKHTGVTDFVNDNIANNTGHLSILRYVQSQCRHTSITTTEKYLKKLHINIKVSEDYIYD